MNNFRKNYLERIKQFLFEENWIEPPLLTNYNHKVLRFDLESKPETGSAQLIKNILDDIFYVNSDMIVIFYGNKWIRWRNGKKYFKKFSLKKILYKKYT